MPQQVSRENLCHQEKVKKLAKEFNAIFVPLQEVFETASNIIEEKESIWDYVHPTITGHELIARQWLRVVGEQLYKKNSKDNFEKRNNTIAE